MGRFTMSGTLNLLLLTTLLGAGAGSTCSSPVALGIALFVLLPAAYCLALVLLAERLLRCEERWGAGARARSLLPSALWVPLAPLFALLSAWAVVRGVGRTSWGSDVTGARPGRDAARGNRRAAGRPR